MTKINNIFKTVIFATLCSAGFSFIILNLFPHSPQNIHWLFSIAFHLAVALVLAIFALINPDPKALVSNLMSITFGRLLASGIAFFIYHLKIMEIADLTYKSHPYISRVIQECKLKRRKNKRFLPYSE